LNLNSATGGSAKGIPLNEKYSNPEKDFSTAPKRSPVVIETLGP